MHGFLAALAQLAVAGVDVRTGRLFQGRDAADPATAAATTRAGWTVDGQLVRRADGTIPPAALHPARRVTELIVPQNNPAPALSGSDALVAEFLRTSREMVNAQRDVLLRYFGSAEAMPTTLPSVLPAVQPMPAVVAAAPVPTTAPVLDGDSVLRSVLAVVAERTGYPVEMIEPGLDLEADLSVDSIKRAEIAGELASRLGLSVDAGADLDEVSTARTAAGIAELLTARLGTAVVAAPVPAAAPVLDRDSVLRSVLAVVAERTGYPVEMIEPGLDLEADLSVDSIKRAEIAGELAARLGLSVDAGADLDEVSTARTAAGIADLLVARLGDGTPAEPAATPEPASADAIVVAPQRLEFVETELTAPGATLALGTTVLLLGGGDFAAVLAQRLRAAGAEPEALPTGALPQRTADAVFYLDALDAPESPLPEAFPVFQHVLAGNPRHLIAVERRQDGVATGLRGFFRSVAREYPDTASTLVEVGTDDGAEAVADALVAELAATDREPVVLADGGRRRALALSPTDLGSLGATGAGPAGDGAAEAIAVGLDRDSVVLLVGGARGITARFARTVAAASRCRIELLGRTPVPAPIEDAATAAAPDRDRLRAAFIATGMTVPARIERAVSGVLAEREVRETMRTLRELGGQVRYHSVDVLDEEAVRTTVKDIHAEHGRLDGVVYAAGVIEDKLIAEKSVESFRRVFATKVDGAKVLLDAVDTLSSGPRFAVLFGSIAAALGNRGQSDYAAANDALEELGRRWSTDERRGLTVHWGPWAAAETNGGMVTPELMRSYAARGIKLIDPEEGPLSLLRELAWGAPTVHSVVYTASGW